MRLQLFLLTISVFIYLSSSCTNDSELEMTMSSVADKKGCTFEDLNDLGKSSNKNIVFDTHAHVFNGLDIPMEAVLDELQLKWFGLDIVVELIADATIIQNIRNKAPSVEAEIKEIDGLLAYYDIVKTPPQKPLQAPASTFENLMVTPEDFDEEFTQIIDDAFDSLFVEDSMLRVNLEGVEEFDNFIEYINESDLDPGVHSDYDSLYQGFFEPSISTASYGDKTKKFFIYILGHPKRNNFSGPIRRLIRNLRNSGTGALSFLKRLERFRFLNALELICTYSVHYGDVDVYAAALVDIHEWLSYPSFEEGITSVRDQIRIMEKIALLTRGKILPLVSYDPITDIRTGGENLRAVEDAILNRGFVGVKIYPTMGFRAYGNSELSDFPEYIFTRSSSNRREIDKEGFGKELDKKLGELYDLCIKYDIPVMAHCNRSMGKSRTLMERAAPTFWFALKEISKFRELKINLGHFGGERGLYAKDYQKKPSWTWEIASSPIDGVWADIGFWDEAIIPQRKQKEKRELQAQRFSELFTKTKSSERMMYGSDWFMLAKSPARVEYYRFYEALFKQHQTRPIRQNADNFFSYNAIKYFGLHKKRDQTRKRLREYYGKQLKKMPEWYVELEKVLPR